VVSHNIIVVHNQLLRFPDIAFFVSPIPLHIAAMVILFGHMSRCESLTRQVALEDVWMALDMLPSFRWRWERREMSGSHPLIATLAEKVLGVNLRQAGPSSHPVLMPEIDWDIEITSSPVVTHTAASTPSLGNATYTHGGSGAPSFPGSPPIGPALPATSRGLVPGVGNGNGGGANGPVETKLAEVPVNLFYPFYPEASHVQARNASTISTPSAAATAAASATAPAGGSGNGNTGGDYTQLLAQAAAAQQQSAPWGASGRESYMLEEKDVGVPMQIPSAMNMWMPPDQRAMRGYVIGP
jgi:hypothetical protein